MAPLAPDSTDKTDSLAIPLPPSGRGSEKWWGQEVSQATKRRKKELPTWKANLDRYRGLKPALKGVNQGHVVNVNVEFGKTEAKKAQLFFQQPDVQLSPRDGQVAEQTALFKEVLNFYLGPDEADVLSMVDEVLLDCLCPAGMGVTKIGYEEAKVDKAVPVNDPATGQQALHPVTGEAQTQTVPQRIYCRFYWERISPSDALIPAGWLSQNWDKAPWLAFEYDVVDPQKEAADRPARLSSSGDGGLATEETLSAPNDREFLAKRGKGIEVWYRTAVYDPTVTDPRRYRRLVLESGARGERTVKVHEDSPYQVLGPSGEYVSGMLGNPIHILTTRPMSDSAYVPSDCTISRNQVDELSKGRTQQMTQRDRNIPLRAVDKNRIDKTTLDQIEKGQAQSIILCDDDPDKVVKAVAQSQMAPENMTFNAALTADINELWALGPNQSGSAAPRQTTATESANIARGVDTRLVKERGRVEGWYVRGVLKFSALLQQFGDDTVFVPITGEQNTSVLTAWDKTKTPGRYLFRVRPDSSVRIDESEDLDRLLRAYNLLAKDPHINRPELLTQIVSKFGLDPAKVIVAQLPPPNPEPPKPAISLKAEDLGNPLVQQLLKQFGITITPLPPPQVIGMPPTAPSPMPGGALPQGPGVPIGGGLPHAPIPVPAVVRHRIPPHGGAADRADMLDKHEGDRSGRRSGPGPL